MRGIYSSVTDIRRQVFTEVARMAYEGGDYSRVEELPYKILPGEVSKYRDSIFLERAIVGERLRLSMGLPLRPIDEHAPLSTGIERPPAGEILRAAPHQYHQIRLQRLPGKIFSRDGYVPGLPGTSPAWKYVPRARCPSCTAKALSTRASASSAGSAPTYAPTAPSIRWNAPCAKACGMDAIGSRRAGPREDRLRQVRVLRHVPCKLSFRRHRGQKPDLPRSSSPSTRATRVIAAVAPAFVGQFGPDMTPEKLKPSMKLLGFDDVVEVAIGADLCTIEEAKDFMREVPEQQPFMATSCCPAWSVMAKKLFRILRPISPWP